MSPPPRKPRALRDGLSALLAADPEAHVSVGHDIVRAGVGQGDTPELAAELEGLGWHWSELLECWELSL